MEKIQYFFLISCNFKGLLNSYHVFNTLDLLNLFYKMLVKLRYFFLELFILSDLNISVFKIVIHILFYIVFCFIASNYAIHS